MGQHTEKIIFISVISMLLAQFVKFIISAVINKKADGRMLFTTGGMPSSHSALVTALVAAIGFYEGIDTTSFAVALVLAMVIVHDSVGVRYEASKHARSLNEIKKRLNIIENIEAEERKLKESLGHKPLEAVMGVLFGFVIALIVYLVWK